MPSVVCRSRCTACAFALAAVLALLSTTTAPALPGPPSFSTGFVDEANFQSPIASVRALWFARARALGSRWVRLGAYWNQIAPLQPAAGFAGSDPGDPGYDFSRLDAGVRSATASHQNVLVMLLGPPTWALGANPPAGTYPGTWQPSPSALAAFAHAVALRYSGRFPDPLLPGRSLPRVTRFQVWNEPNLPTYLSPQWVRGPGGAWAPVSPAIYRTLLNAAYRAIKSVQPHALVLSAGTAPYGDPPGVGRMAPVVFLRELVCLHGAALNRERCPDPPHFDAADHHPYTLTPTHHAFGRDDVSLPDLGKLQRILRIAARRHTVMPAGVKPLWVTEIDWDSNPPDRASSVSLAGQARDLALAFYELWHQGVGHVLWFVMRDISYKSLTGAGVYFANGTAKPSAAAYRFPFVALGRRGGTVTLWGRAPAPGLVTIERRVSGGRWRALARLRTSADGVFDGVRPAAAGSMRLRALEGRVASLPWSVG